MKNPPIQPSIIDDLFIEEQENIDVLDYYSIPEYREFRLTHAPEA